MRNQAAVAVQAVVVLVAVAPGPERAAEPPAERPVARSEERRLGVSAPGGSGRPVRELCRAVFVHRAAPERRR